RPAIAGPGARIVRGDQQRKIDELRRFVLRSARRRDKQRNAESLEHHQPFPIADHFKKPIHRSHRSPPVWRDSTRLGSGAKPPALMALEYTGCIGHAYLESRQICCPISIQSSFLYSDEQREGRYDSSLTTASRGCHETASVAAGGRRAGGSSRDRLRRP